MINSHWKFMIYDLRFSLFFTIKMDVIIAPPPPSPPMRFECQAKLVERLWRRIENSRIYGGKILKFQCANNSKFNWNGAQFEYRMKSIELNEMEAIQRTHSYSFIEIQKSHSLIVIVVNILLIAAVVASKKVAFPLRSYTIALIANSFLFHWNSG